METKIKQSVIQTADRTTKINYLKGIGLFKLDSLNGMSETELNGLVLSAVEVKGY